MKIDLLFLVSAGAEEFVGFAPHEVDGDEARECTARRARPQGRMAHCVVD
jgi:hypothetical protein